MGLRSTLLGIVLQDLPSPTSVLHDNDPRFDALQGGRIGPGKWGRYEYPYGTTCATTVVGWLLDAGAPADMLNAAPPGGSGFTPGAHFTKLNAGAKSRGWWRTPVRGQLPDFRPGDIYEINHGDGSNSHVGVIVSSTPSADGSNLVVETADGGQGTKTSQEISRQTRTFSLGTNGHAVAYSAKYSSGWLDGWIAVGGSGDDGVEGSPTTDGMPTTPAPVLHPPSASGDPYVPVDVDDDDDGGGAGGALVFAAAGVLLIFGAAAFYAAQRPAA